MVLPVCFAASSETIQLLDRQGDVAMRLHGHARGVNTLAWSPQASALASASWDDTIRLWNGSGECVRVVDGFEDSVESVEFAPSGDLVATSRDRTVRIVEKSGRQRVLARLDCMPSRGALSPNGRTIAIATDDEFALILDIDGGTPTRLPHLGPVYSVSWNADGRLATVCEDGAVRLFDTQGKLLRTSSAADTRAVQVAWHPDGVHVAAGFHDGTARVFDADLQPVVTIENGKEVTLLAFTPTADLLAVGSGRGELTFHRLVD